VGSSGPLAKGSRYTKVGEGDVPPLVNQNVGRIHVAVNDTPGVYVLQGHNQLGDQVSDLSRRHLSCASDLSVNVPRGEVICKEVVVDIISEESAQGDGERCPCYFPECKILSQRQLCIFRSSRDYLHREIPRSNHVHNVIDRTR